VRKHLSAFPEYEKVKVYCDEAMKKRELERVGTDKQKTGIFTGWYAINDLNGKELPIYVADFALGTVGTGCLVGVPGHDLRDFEFAQAMKLPIVRVVVGADGDTSDITDPGQVQEEEGTMINSGFLDGMEIHAATQKIIDYMVEKGCGKRVTNYKLRDWLISRQRFWGAPIPMRKVDGEKRMANGEMQKYAPVDESELPVVLPMDVQFKPTGKSPLSEHPDFQDREVDTMDTFVDSSWYFFRFAQLTSPELREKVARGHESNPFDDATLKERLNTWCPVDLYVGGAEHTVLHLLYARFFTKVLFDAGYINFQEPFLKLRHQGTILGPDHRKMSKRWGNVINPLDVIAQYGADTLRMYEMFLGPLDQMKPWNVGAVSGTYRFLSRVWNMGQTLIISNFQGAISNKSVVVSLHKMIKKVTEDIPALKFNTAIAECMIFMNTWEKAGAEALSREDLEKFLLILAPYAPYMTEELWSQLGHSESIHTNRWPAYDSSLLITDTVEIPVQVNGKVRGIVTASRNEIGEEWKIVELAKENPAIQKHLLGDISKTIYVPGKILNIICK
jgi:leucyl-tRNA synthetase